MGVEFEWELDSDREWHTPPPKRPRRLPRRATAIFLVIFLVGLAIGAGHFWQQVRQGEENLKRDLKSVANLEARALRDGDQATFLWLQDQGDAAWYARQKERFSSPNSPRELEPSQQVTLAVLDAGLMPEDRAWAEVAWALEDGVYRRAQFYQRGNGRWLRTNTQLEYFGPQQSRETAHFAFSYLARDAPTAEWMESQLEAWYAAVCADLGCDDQRTINVLLTLDGDAPPQYRPPQGFMLVSPRSRGVREDGALLPGERGQLARMLIYLLVARQAGDVQPDRQPYLLSEFINWELGRLGLAGDEAWPTPMLDYRYYACSS
jgi:hypothetical protein